MECERMDVEDSVEANSGEAGCTEKEKPLSAVTALLGEEEMAATCSKEHENVEEIVEKEMESDQSIEKPTEEKNEVVAKSEAEPSEKCVLEEPEPPKEPEAEHNNKAEEELKEDGIITETKVTTQVVENVELTTTEETKQIESVETEDLNKEIEINKEPEKMEAVEESSDKTEVDDGNESQESIALVIDEKSIEQEPLEDDKKEDTTESATKTTENAAETPETDKEVSKKDTDTKEDENYSCEETSEISTVTPIDTAELDSEVVDKSTTNIIEIDDDVEDEDEEVSANIIDKGDEEKATVPAKTKEEEDNVTVIEIDDEDDDEEMKEVPSFDTGIQETKNVEENEIRLDDKTLAAEIVSEMDVDAEKPAVIEIIKNDDVEMKECLAKSADKTDTKDSEIKEETTALLQEIEPRPASPKPTAEDQAQCDDTTDEVFYNKECINHECPHNHKQYFRVTQFAFSYYKVNKKKFKTQYICGECYDKALDVYEEYCGLLMAKQPLMLKQSASNRQDIVEIIDSSDDEDAADKTGKEKAEKPYFSKADLELIEKELENSIKSVMARSEIQNQLTWSKTILETRLKKLAEDTKFIGDELNALQKKADTMHEALYQCPKIKIRQLQPLDLNSGLPYAPANNELPQLPPIGEIHRPPIQLGEVYYAVKNKAIASWVPCKVIEQVESLMGLHKNITHYKIKFLKSQYQMLKTVSVKHLAYYNPPPVRLPIGVRVIAYFDATSLSRGKEKMVIQSAFYPGIVAEPLKPNNKYRYLIFYDDGYTQYVYHKDVRLVCNVSENVWEDVHPGSRDFIQKYLTQYSINRPMVQTQKGQSMTTESNGKWIYARVVDIDCSLIQMQFEGPKSHTEWIYRGSMRLGPVFKEYQKSLQKDTMPISRLPRRTEPFIRYTEDEEATSSQQTRAVAKKSVSRQDSTASQSSTSQNATAAAAAAAQQQTAVPIVRHLNNSTIYLEDESKPKGKVVYYTAKRNLPPLLYKKHYCSPTCLFKITHNLSAYSPLSKPLLSGWERIILRQKIKKVVAYRAPCGKIFRNMKELRKYLRVTENVLNVDNFDFCHETNCLAEYVIESAIVQRRDISNGLEKMALPLVNYYDNTMPPECKYAAQRIPTEGVNLNLNEEFLVGCDCDDDCSDKAKCSCWQLTYAGAKYGNPNTPMEEIGYQYKRLYEHVPTGIYECNSRCKCKSNCLNRVAQHSLEMKLQVFKTSNRGWGLRCINDVPRGSFICIYAGHLLTEAKANEGGLDAGDEYFAELDYIEVAEQIKEGYESDVELPEPEEEEDLYAPEQDDDDEFTPSKSFITRSKNRARLMRSHQPHNAEDGDSQERQVINFNPNAEMNENSMRESSIRTLFGKDEACYVMDAKITGNLGRYFNHSCSPNLFVQNVFVDTHDLRFPWVAFFSSTHIRAGTELTWNYNYEVGVVPGKVLYCQCGAPNCRLRLL